MGPITILAGPSSLALARALANAIGAQMFEAEARVFPDNEVWTRVPEGVAGSHVVIVQGTHPPQDRNLQHLFQMVEAAKSLSPASVSCVVPYMAYSRQDRRDHPGEPISSHIVLRTLEMLGASNIITVEMHNPAVTEIVKIPVLNLGADVAYAEFIRTRIAPQDPVLVSPDRGSAARVQRLAKLTGWPMAVLAKKKTWSDGTWYEAHPEGVEGRDVVVIDDLCSSGSTLQPLSTLLREAGVRSQAHIFAHFLGDFAKVRAKVPEDVRLYATDTVPSEMAAISITPVIARAILGDVEFMRRAS